jgi:SynChlorMet cassette protein ScmC
MSAEDLAVAGLASRVRDILGVAPSTGCAGRPVVFRDRRMASSRDEQRDRRGCSAHPVVVSGRPDATWALVSALRQLMAIVECEPAASGGLFLHAALAEWQGHGVLLAGPSDVGKSTASARLVPPWRSLCDDTTLVVRTSLGEYWAHPWPTLSRFFPGGSGGSWEVQHAVRISGVFFLRQAAGDSVEAVGPGHAVALLVHAAEQATLHTARELDEAARREQRLRRFGILCELAKVVPTHVLDVSLGGTFWRSIEQVLEASAGP